jgi:3-polyprenyl-4-hydroxybenzoate decarboxylase
MTAERKPIAFGDMRNWMKALNAAGELREIDAEVDWNVELGTVTRINQGPGTGPALLFKNIKDYNKNTTRCGQAAPSTKAAFRRASSRKAPARRTSSPARISTCSSFRCRSGIASTAAAIY